jgi:hypothetical protein
VKKLTVQELLAQSILKKDEARKQNLRKLINDEALLIKSQMPTEMSPRPPPAVTPASLFFGKQD